MIETPGILWSALWFVIAIGPLIFLHELGHYGVGRIFGVKADAFSIGFGKEVFGWTDKRGTRWKVGWMPLGGYVRFAGDMTATSAPNEAWRNLPDGERCQTFHSKTVWQRALIVLAGPVTNLVIAIVILSGFVAIYGEAKTPPIVERIAESSAAAKAGLQIGDRILSIDGDRVDRFEDVAPHAQDNAGQRLLVEVERAGQTLAFTVIPSTVVEKDRFGNIYRFGRMGISSPPFAFEKAAWYRIPGIAVRQTVQLLERMIDGIGQIITGRRPIEELGGPLKIAQMSGQVATLGWANFFTFVAMISINLGFINLLPIPTLDGGHLTFYALEALRRKPVSLRVQELAFGTGMVLVLSFMVFVTLHNDFRSLGIWDRLAGLIG